MTVTEAEAKEKWCPFARRVTPSGAGSYNRSHFGTHIDAAPCLAAHCMAWRWRDPLDLGPDRAGFCGLVERD